MRRVISIIFYVISGYFFFSVCFMASWSIMPTPIKYAVMFFGVIPATTALFIGLACTRFEKWKRDVGIVFISATGFMALMILIWVCIFFSPEFEEFFPGGKAKFAGVYGDYVSGLLCTAVFGTAGILLILSSRRKNTGENASQSGDVPSE